MTGDSAKRSYVDRLVPLGALLARLPLLLLATTWRVRVAAGGDVLERFSTSGEPAIFAFWHEGIFPCGHYLYRLGKRRGLRLAILASRSRDGELVARMARASGFETVRGSTSRGGLSGLLSLRRALARDGASIVATPDGPRGPARRSQAGVAALASASGAPIVPMASAADRSWRLRSWDRLMIPKPFARVTLAIGAPLEVPEGTAPATAAMGLTEVLDGLMIRAATGLDERWRSG